MNPLHVDEVFSDALRKELTAQVVREAATAGRRRAKLLLGTGALIGTGLLGAGAAVAGFLSIPGGEKVTPLASPVTNVYTGTATVDLGTPPDGTTGIKLELWCLTPGWFEFPDGSSSSCSQADVDNGRTGWTGYTIGLSPGQDSVTIKTDPENRWKLTAEYVKQERTPLGVNAKGETYGVESPENGAPDLIAVMATNGQFGYAYARDLYGGPLPTSPEDAVKNFSTPRPPREIPVFQSDGETQIGIFMAAGGGGGIPFHPTPSPAPR